MNRAILEGQALHSRRGEIWAVVAALFAVGATLVAVAALLPGSAVASVPAVVALVAGAYASSAATWVLRGRLPAALQVPVTVAGSVMIAIAVSLPGDSPTAGAFAMLYVLGAMFSFYYYSAWLAGVLQGFSGACLALALEQNAGSTVIWLMAMGTSTTVGLVVRFLSRRLNALATTDRLTGLPNRGAWELAADRERGHADRWRRPLSVALLDLDHFKQVNDSAGHGAGDQVLQHTATAWSVRLRRGDVLARFGGDEFALLVPGCDVAAASALVDQLLAGLPDGRRCSAGIAAWQPGEELDEVLLRADAALYRAKHAGRNQAVVDRLGEVLPV